MFTPPAVTLQGMIAAGFVDSRITDLRLRLQRSNRKEIEVLEGPARQRLAAIVGETMANNRLASARGRQGALDSGDLIPKSTCGDGGHSRCACAKSANELTSRRLQKSAAAKC